MKSLKSEVYRRIIIIFVVPILLINLLSFYMFNKITVKKYAESTMLTAEKVRQLADSSVSAISKYCSYIEQDREICRIIKEVDFYQNDVQVFEAVKSLDHIISRYFANENYFEGIVIFGGNGSAYTNGLVPERVDFQKFYSSYHQKNQYIEGIGYYHRLNLSEFGMKDEDAIIFSNSIYDSAYFGDNKYLGTYYILFNERIFNDAFLLSGIENGIAVVLSDTTGRTIAKNNTFFKNVWNYKDDFGKLLNERKSSFEYAFDANKSVVTYCTSDLTNWKSIIITPSDVYFNEIKTMIIINILLELLLVLIITLLYRWTMGNIFSTIDYFVKLTEEVGEGNFGIKPKFEAKYSEFAIILNGFNKMKEEIRNLIESLVEAKQKKNELEIRALRYQINPHFLYNILGTVRLMAVCNKQTEISDVLNVLIRMLRNTISAGTREIEIGNELMNIKDYIYIQQVLHQNRLHVFYEVDEDVAHVKIPAMLIQPIIENAIKHGIAERMSEDDNATIRICIRKVAEDVAITVWDNGVGIERKKIAELLNGEGSFTDGDHLGMGNVNSRIVQEFGTDYGIRIESEIGKYTQITMLLPRRDAE